MTLKFSKNSTRPTTDYLEEAKVSNVKRHSLLSFTKPEWQPLCQWSRCLAGPTSDKHHLLTGFVNLYR